MSKSNKQRIRKRIRSRIFGETARPRLNVFKSNKYIYAQIIDDTKGHTIIGLQGKDPIALGEKLGELALRNKINKIRFDRGIYKYHGKIKELAESLRKKGLEF
jgi:large subunit ribosomal protein L18